MAGVSVESGRGRRRSLDMEINMVPMIDLLMVTISFLLLTAVWTHTQRLDGTTQVPGPPVPGKTMEPVARLHVQVPADDGPLRVTVRRGVEVLDVASVPRGETSHLADRLDTLRRAHPADLASEDSHVVVVHADNAILYRDMVAVMDGISEGAKYRVNLATK